ncbi:MAG: heme o synthase [Bdellovibrionales bacterium]
MTTMALTSSTVADFITLLKPRVMSLVVFSGIAGLIMASAQENISIHPLVACAAVLAIALSAGAAAAINMWYDRDIDAIMKRTQNRPIPAGRVTPQAALEYGVVLSIIATFIMALATNWVAAALLTIANLFYVFVYTMWLKRTTPQNIVIGGAAGAFPPMIGWATVTGDVTLVPILLFALIFFWTPPHFWALALIKRDDYGAAGIPMLPNVKGDKHTKWQMLIYTLILLPLSLSLFAVGAASELYAASAAILSAAFIGFAVRVLLDDDNSRAGRMFAWSIIYLFALFALLIADNI